MLLIYTSISSFPLQGQQQVLYDPDDLPDLKNYNLNFNYLPATWDEGLPLGNGEIGALIWENQGRLRMSLDHVGLWDLREAENLSGEEFTFAWVKEQWENNEYHKVQELFDLANIRFAFTKAAELAKELRLEEDAKK